MSLKYFYDRAVSHASYLVGCHKPATQSSSIPFTATTATEIDPATSAHEIGGNGSHSGNFQGGFVTPISVPEPNTIFVVAGLAMLGLFDRDRRV